MELAERIGRQLQERYTFTDIDAFFAAMNISTNGLSDYWGGSNSKNRYAKAVLARLSEPDFLRVADELGLKPIAKSISDSELPDNWRETKDFRLFISHISEHKSRATRLKEALSIYSISGFVAHEDITPTLAWQDEIERALNTMDAFVAVHTPKFSQSVWTQQEIGYALGRGVMVISFKMGEDPAGFIGKHQALPHRDRTAEQIAEEIDKLLAADARTRQRLEEAKSAAWVY